MDFNYKKVIVLGNNGSGKSYFSKKLAEMGRQGTVPCLLFVTNL